MSLEEKANYYSNYEFAEENEKTASYHSFIDGYEECKTDLIDFVKANPKSTAEQILKHLEEINGKV